MTAVQKNVSTPQIERIACGSVNCYIISQGGRAVLIDTAAKKYRELLLEKCRAKNVGLILITHGHYDHCQKAARLARELNVPIAMHPADIPLLESIMSGPLEAKSLFGKSMVFVIRLGSSPVPGKAVALFQDSSIEPVEPDIELCDGFSLMEYGVDARVIALPGHTMGSVGVLVGDNDLVVGDALMNIGRPSRAAHYQDRAAMEASAGKITALGDNITIHFGHGKPVRNRAW